MWLVLVNEVMLKFMLLFYELNVELYCKFMYKNIMYKNMCILNDGGF